MKSKKLTASQLILVITLFITILSNCKKEKLELKDKQIDNNEFNLTSDEIKSLILLKKNHSVAPDIAISYANQIKEHLDNLENPSILKSTSSQARNISEIRRYKFNSSLKSSKNITEQDSTADLFVFNFSSSSGQEKGFAIISGDERVSPIIGYSSEGNLKDTIDNPGDYVLLSGVGEYMKNEIAASEKLRDSTLASALEKIKETLPDSIKGSIDTTSLFGSKRKRTSALSIYYPVVTTTTTPWVVKKQVGPYSNTSWDQRSPYNDKAPIITCDGQSVRAVAGCVNIAFAQIMAYHKKPDNLFGVFPLEWNNMLTNKNAIFLDLKYQNMVSQLISYISTYNYTKYSCDGASSDGLLVAINLSRYGYVSGGQMDYDLNSITTSLDNKRPVFAEGARDKYTVTVGWWVWKVSYETYDHGHAWVIDGYRALQAIQTTTISIYYGSEVVNSYTFSSQLENKQLHCNFGWNNFDNNRYYESKLFSTSLGTYQYFLRIIPDIRPL